MRKKEINIESLFDKLSYVVNDSFNKLKEDITIDYTSLALNSDDLKLLEGSWSPDSAYKLGILKSSTIDVNKKCIYVVKIGYKNELSFTNEEIYFTKMLDSFFNGLAYNNLFIVVRIDCNELIEYFDTFINIINSKYIKGIYLDNYKSNIIDKIRSNNYDGLIISDTDSETICNTLINDSCNIVLSSNEIFQNIYNKHDRIINDVRNGIISTKDYLEMLNNGEDFNEVMVDCSFNNIDELLCFNNYKRIIHKEKIYQYTYDIAIDSTIVLGEDFNIFKRCVFAGPFNTYFGNVEIEYPIYKGYNDEDYDEQFIQSLKKVSTVVLLIEIVNNEISKGCKVLIESLKRRKKKIIGILVDEFDYKKISVDTLIVSTKNFGVIYDVLTKKLILSNKNKDFDGLILDELKYDDILIDENKIRFTIENENKYLTSDVFKVILTDGDKVYKMLDFFKVYLDKYAIKSITIPIPNKYIENLDLSKEYKILVLNNYNNTLIEDTINFENRFIKDSKSMQELLLSDRNVLHKQIYDMKYQDELLISFKARLLLVLILFLGLNIPLIYITIFEIMNNMSYLLACIVSLVVVNVILLILSPIILKGRRKKIDIEYNSYDELLEYAKTSNKE